MTMKKGLIYGSAMAILAVGLFFSVSKASADTVVYSSSSSSSSASASASASAVAEGGDVSVEVETDHNDHDRDHNKKHKKSTKKLPATGSDMLILAGLAMFAGLVVFLGTREYSTKVK